MFVLTGNAEIDGNMITFIIPDDIGAGTVVSGFGTDSPTDTIVVVIQYGTDSGLFSINSDKALVYHGPQRGPEDGPANFEINLRIVTLDTSTNELTSHLFEVEVVIKEAPPVFTSGTTANLDENNAIDAEVYKAVAISMAGDITYELFGEDATRLTINKETGVVTLNEIADFETKSEYRFDVVATNDDGSTMHSVSLAITNVNEFAIFIDDTGNQVTSYAFTVREDITAGEMLGIVNATDLDEGLGFYSLTQGADMFKIDAMTGIVTLIPNMELDYETLQSHELRAHILVIDTFGNELASIDITINVDNVAEPPVFTSGATAVLAENNAPGVEVYTALATSKAGEIEYILSGEDAERLTFNKETGVVTLNESADFERKPEYRFDVIATNVDGSTTQNVNLAIRNENEPTFFVDDMGNKVTSYTFMAREGIDDNEVIGIIRPFDQDGVVIPRFSLTLDSNIDMFEIMNTVDNNNGVLSLRRGMILDYETQQNHELILQFNSVDNFGRTQVEIEIMIVVVSQSPVFTSGTTANLDENNALDAEVYKAAATSMAGNITYSLSGEDAERLTLNKETGVVTLNESANFERKPEYRFDVTATNDEGSTTQSVNLSIINVDEPDFFIDDIGNKVTSYTFTVREDIADRAVVGFILAIDPDAGTIYHRTSQDHDIFRIYSTGAIVLRKGVILDYETQQSYVLTSTNLIFHRTFGLYEGQEIQITINVVDTPIAPEIDLDNKEVNEITIAQKLATISFVDAGDNTVNEIISDIFELRNNNELWLRADAALDYEIASSHTIGIKAFFTGDEEKILSLPTIFTLNLIDVDEAATILMVNPRRPSINENTRDQKLATISFIDDALGTNTVNEIISDIFELRNNNELWLRDDAQLDYETASIHTIEISAFSTGVGEQNLTTRFTLRVMDVDESETSAALIEESVAQATAPVNSIAQVQKFATISFIDDALGIIDPIVAAGSGAVFNSLGFTHAVSVDISRIETNIAQLDLERLTAFDSSGGEFENAEIIVPDIFARDDGSQGVLGDIVFSYDSTLNIF